MTKSLILTAGLCAGLTLTLARAEDGEKKVTIEKIPPAAARAIEKLTGGEKLAGLSQEKDEGKTVFEAAFMKNGRKHEVTVDGEGKQLSDEQVIPVEEAPKAVQEAIKREHPTGKLEKLEKVTEKGATNFEALISDKSKREEITFDGKGKVVERENKTGKKGND